MIAQVVIDLKTLALNRFFDYLVPSESINIVQKGMRVIVPFGKNNSHRLGYIINLKAKSEFADKYLINILDDSPYFNQELFLLAEEMLKTPFITKALVYQTIIPKELLITYLKEITIIKKELIPEYIKPLCNKKDKILLNAKNHLLKNLKKLSNKGVVEIKDFFKLRNKEKTTFFYNINPQWKQIKNLKITSKQKDFLNNFFKKITFCPLTLNKKNTKTIEKKQALQLATKSIIQSLLRKGVILQEEKTVDVVLEHHFDFLASDKKIILNEEQKQLLKKIVLNQHNIYLLHGKTGSGKTEIYLNLIDEILKQKKQSLILVPEVMLIAPLMQRLQAKFPQKKIAILHSYLNPLQRYTQLKKIKSQEVSIVLGTRSAIFAPLNKLGIIIIDEEHDESFIENKQAPYDSKELAQIRARYNQIPLILGSATPSLGSYYQVFNQKYQLLKLTKRALIDSFPPIKLIDMKEELKKGNLQPFSTALQTALKQTLAKKEQAILFINAKGFAPFVLCRFCGFVPKCYNCNNSLTFYNHKNILKCNYCNYRITFIQKCSQCQTTKIKPIGLGIEYIESYLQKNFPQTKILKFDSDSVTKIVQYEKLWNNFNKAKADVLLGTQMVTKGLDFHQVTLVAILIADTLLKIPSFKASEKTFQLLIQASGRCARKKAGQVIVQSYNLNHFAITKAIRYDESGFIKQALEERKISQNPPFAYLSKILISHSDFQNTIDIANQIKNALQDHFHNKIKILGPVMSMMPKKNNLYRCLLTLKYHTWPLDLDFILEANVQKNASIFFDRFASLL